MPDFYWLNQIQINHRPCVGEKALILSQLQNRGYPILPGFVVPNGLWHEFLVMFQDSHPLLAELTDSSLHLNVEDYLTLQQVAQAIRHDITQQPLPEQWPGDLYQAAQKLNSPALLLRPSFALQDNSPLSFQGLVRSQACWCHPQALATALKQLWSEVFRARCLFFWQRNNIPLKSLTLAVLIQPLQNALASGTLQMNQTHWQVQATWGLGHSWVRGEVIPDTLQGTQGTTSLDQQTLGHKGRAYTLSHSPPDSPLTSCLEVERVAEEQQNQYTLNPSTLQDLLHLAEQLNSQHPDNFSIEWLLTPTSSPEPSNPDPQQLYITQYNRHSHDNLSVVPTPMDKTAPLVTGLAASPGEVVAPIFFLDHSQTAHIPQGQILVMETMAADWLPLLSSAAGLVIEQGSLTSHGAIMARELGIPALVEAVDALQLLEPGERVRLNGTDGAIYAVAAESDSPVKGVPSPSPEPQPQSFYPLGTQLLVNLSQPEVLPKIEHFPLDGVGLLRSELMMVGLLQAHPLSWWLKHPEQLVESLTTSIRDFAQTFAPRPVWYRSTDWRSQEFPPLPQLPEQQGNNPLLGIRGTFTYQHNDTLFQAELQALAQVQRQFKNLKLILPFVRSVEEWKTCYQSVQQQGLMQLSGFELWMMAEVPSVLFLLPEYVKAGVQGIAIGTNDFTQLLLGVDGQERCLAEAFNARHPAVLAAVKQLITTSQQLEIPCIICGQAPVKYPELIDKLIPWGITGISVEPEAVFRTYQQIARAEQRFLLQATRKIMNN
ncbi:PEP/pyruvate-binding domain-containing protein [Spirulina sp. CS-785/01]|uniref:putative PEP-binding protein n=1 Tax=Spirulina sp. CS-785/01 TaxID=3021716 RepID=UPI002330523D|nr:putative PEP-binding protein [Spirulina sp. CS-785/01]MDB9312344.1 PEP/pyruvate-binding domain-containing protein [Spirulina sp. CS-785/01]